MFPCERKKDPRNTVWLVADGANKCASCCGTDSSYCSSGVMSSSTQKLRPCVATTRSLLFSFFLDRKSTRLNSSLLVISYAVFCLKKKKKRPRLLRGDITWRVAANLP